MKLSTVVQLPPSSNYTHIYATQRKPLLEYHNEELKGLKKKGCFRPLFLQIIVTINDNHELCTTSCGHCVKENIIILRYLLK